MVNKKIFVVATYRHKYNNIVMEKKYAGELIYFNSNSVRIEDITNTEVPIMMIPRRDLINIIEKGTNKNLLFGDELKGEIYVV